MHPLVSHIPVPPLDSKIARGLNPWASPTEVIRVLDRMCKYLVSDGALINVASSQTGKTAAVYQHRVPRQPDGSETLDVGTPSGIAQ